MSSTNGSSNTSQPISPWRKRITNLGGKLFRKRGLLLLPFAIMFVLAPIQQKPMVTELAAGVLLTIAGLLLRFWCNAYAGIGTRRVSESKPEALLTTGPFAYIRNPIYVGNLLAFGGLLLCVGYAWKSLVMLFPLFLIYCLIVDYEEDLLYRQFGEPYQHYKQKTGRWIPRLIPVRQPPSLENPSDIPETCGPVRSWPKAWHNEKHTIRNLLIIFVLRGLSYAVQVFACGSRL